MTLNDSIILLDIQLDNDFDELFFKIWPLFLPLDSRAHNPTYDTIQLAVSKVLVFGVLSFMLYLAARNYLSHKHNAIINRHRQQALQTYQALVDAAAGSGQSDIILTHAASGIFRTTTYRLYTRW